MSSSNNLLHQTIQQNYFYATLTNITQRRVGNRDENIFTFETDNSYIVDDNFAIPTYVGLMSEGLDLVRQSNAQPNLRWSIRILGSTGFMQVPYQGLGTVLGDILQRLEKINGTYNEDSDFIITGFEILCIATNPDRILALSGKYGIRMIGGDCFISPESQHNCGFICFAFGMRTLYGIKSSDIKYFIEPRGLAKIGADYKKKYPEYRLSEGCTNEMFEAMAKQEGVKLVIYKSDLTTPIINTPGPSSKLIEMVYFGGHVCLIVRRPKLVGVMVEYESFIEHTTRTEVEVDFASENKFLTDLLVELYGSASFDMKMMEEFMLDSLQCYPIKRKFPEKDHNLKIAAWDLESTNTKENGEKQDQVPYFCAYAFYLQDNDPDSTDPRTPLMSSYHPFSGFDCLKDMMHHIYLNGEMLNGYTFYAHNSSKFDHHVMMQHGLFELDDWNVLDMATRGGAILKLILKSKDDKYKIVLLDSLRMMSGPLKELLDEVKTQHRKLDFDHSKVHMGNCLESEGLGEYQKHDVLGLLELMYIFSVTVWKELKINITSCLTSASLAKRNYLQNYYPKSKAKIYKLPRQVDQYIRNGYNGGRVEAMKIGHLKGKFYYYDVTSLYPAEARLPLPCDKPIPVTEEMLRSNPERYGIFYKVGGKTRIKPGIFGFVRCKVTGPHEGYRPLHSIFSNNKLLFPRFNGVETVLFTEEIKLALELELGYEYEVLDYVKFTPVRVLKQVMEDGFRLKAEQAAQGNTTGANTYKIIINSTYGFWGLVVDELDSVKLYREGDSIDIDDRINAMLNENRYRSYLEMNGYHLLRGRYDLKVEDFNVSIAAAITAYSRMCLYRITHAFEKDGANTYYCDTDSVIVDKSIKDCPTVLESFQTDGTGEALGMLKNECTAIIKKKFKDIAATEFEKEPEPYFDEICLLGCKNYALKRVPRFEGGSNIEILKMKGINKKKPITSILDPDGVEEVLDPPRYLKFEDYTLLARDYQLKQMQEQFRAGFETMMSHETKGGSRILEVKKRLCMSYDKGFVNLENSEESYYNVEPLILTVEPTTVPGYIQHSGDRFPGVVMGEITITEPNKNKKCKSVKRTLEVEDESSDDEAY